MEYEAPSIEVVGSMHDLTQHTKYVSASSDGYYLGGGPVLFPLNS